MNTALLLALTLLQAEPAVTPPPPAALRPPSAPPEETSAASPGPPSGLTAETLPADLAGPAVEPPAAAGDPDALTKWGMTLDGGFPDAAGLGVLYRPFHWLRLEASGTTTVYASHGYRLGASLVAFRFWITPSLTVNYGRALEADWNRLLAKFGRPDPDLEPVLRRFGYQYVDAHLGLELGPSRRFVFFLRAGLTQLWTRVHGLSDAATAQLKSGHATVSDSSVTARVPSVKLGFLVYFL